MSKPVAWPRGVFDSRSTTARTRSGRPHVLAALDRCGVKATFFMVGERVERAPGWLARSLERGHDIELHCHRHIRHSDLTDRELRDDTRAALAVFERAGLPRPTRWRAPWGICTEATERVATELELELVHWTPTPTTGGATRAPRCSRRSTRRSKMARSC